jgi:hypothetical protein
MAISGAAGTNEVIVGDEKYPKNPCLRHRLETAISSLP